MSRINRFRLLSPVLLCVCLGCAQKPPAAAPPPVKPNLGAPANPDEPAGNPDAAATNDASPGKTQVSTEFTDPSSSDPVEKNTDPVVKDPDSPEKKPVAKTAAKQPDKNKKASAKPAGPTQVQMNLNLISDDVLAALVVHPKRALGSPLLTGLKEEGAMTDADVEKALQPIMAQTGLNPKDVEEIAILIGKPMVNSVSRDLGLPVDGEAPAAAIPNDQVFRNNLKQVGLAFHNYHDVFGHLPSDSGRGDGENNLGFSWRVQLAPFVEGAPVYNQIDFDQEWDSDHNAELHEQMPAAYVTKGVTDPGQTSLHVITGEGTLFDGDKGLSFRDILDGTSNTILAVSAGADTAENWMQPGGLAFDPEHPLDCLGTIEGDDFLVLMADGSVHTLSKDIDPDVFSKLVTAQDGKAVEFDRSQQGGAGNPGTAGNAAAPFGLRGMKPEAAPVVFVKMAKAVDRQQFLAQLPAPSEAKKSGDQQYFTAKGWAMAFPSENTAVFGGEEAVLAALSGAGEKSKTVVADQLRAADQPFDLLLAVDVSSQKALRQALPQINPLLGPAANLDSLTVAASSSGKVGDSLLAVNGKTTTPEAAQTLAAMVNGLALNQLKTALSMQIENPNLTDDQRELIALFEPGLQALEMTADGNQLQLTWSIPEGFDRLPALMAPAIKDAKESAAQMQKLNHLKQIGLAMHNYHDTFSTFPKAGGPAMEGDTNKDGLSWRVQLLPFLDQAPLYNKFHHDEPWDSEHNKALIAEMPDLFKVEGVDEPGETSIHVFTGEGAPFDGDNAPGIRDFTDGTSNTLLCVVAGPDKADVWTKPGGLELDANDPFAALGDIGETFQALFCDGSVRRIRSTIDPETLLHLIQHHDGTAIEEDLNAAP